LIETSTTVALAATAAPRASNAWAGGAIALVACPATTPTVSHPSVRTLSAGAWMYAPPDILARPRRQGRLRRTFLVAAGMDVVVSRLLRALPSVPTALNWAAISTQRTVSPPPTAARMRYACTPAFPARGVRRSQPNAMLVRPGRFVMDAVSTAEIARF